MRQCHRAAIAGRLWLRRVNVSQWPAKPLADAAAYDPLEILALQPRQVLDEERDALIVGAEHPRQVRAPESATRAKSWSARRYLTCLWPLGILEALAWHAVPLGKGAR